MAMDKARAAGRAKIQLNTGLALLLALVFFLGNGLVSYQQVRLLRESADDVARTHEVIKAQSDLVNLMVNAETGRAQDSGD